MSLVSQSFSIPPLNENEPIVNTPTQAIDCFPRTRMDVLAIGSFFLLKTENTAMSENKSAFAEALAP
jgi:hypothetical protein